MENIARARPPINISTTPVKTDTRPIIRAFDNGARIKPYPVPGDSRVNLDLGTALFRNMFLRFHNFVAFKLRTGRDTWSDETLYQESRRIVGAVIQHVTYAEFLPIILGKKKKKLRSVRSVVVATI